MSEIIFEANYGHPLIVDQTAPGSDSVEVTVRRCGRKKEKPIIIGSGFRCLGHGQPGQDAPNVARESTGQFRCTSFPDSDTPGCRYFDARESAEGVLDELRIGGR